MACSLQHGLSGYCANRRIVFAYTMSMGDRRFSSSQATVELLAAGKGTDLIFTEQGAFFKARMVRRCVRTAGAAV